MTKLEKGHLLNYGASKWQSLTFSGEWVIELFTNKLGDDKKGGLVRQFGPKYKKQNAPMRVEM
jgi:hypothetical protein